MVLVHVRPAHVLGQAGGRRLVVDEVLRALRAAAERQIRVQVEVGGLDHHGDQFARRDLAQDVAGALGAAHVALDQAGVRLVQRGQLLAGLEVDDRRLLERLVGLAPTDGGDVDHAGYLWWAGTAGGVVREGARRTRNRSTGAVSLLADGGPQDDSQVGSGAWPGVAQPERAPGAIGRSAQGPPAGGRPVRVRLRAAAGRDGPRGRRAPGQRAGDLLRAGPGERRGSRRLAPEPGAAAAVRPGFAGAGDARRVGRRPSSPIRESAPTPAATSRTGRRRRSSSSAAATTRSSTRATRRRSSRGPRRAGCRRCRCGRKAASWSLPAGSARRSGSRGSSRRLDDGEATRGSCAPRPRRGGSDRTRARARPGATLPAGDPGTAARAGAGELAAVPAHVRRLGLQPARRHRRLERRLAGPGLDVLHRHQRGPPGAADRQRRHALHHDPRQPRSRAGRAHGRSPLALRARTAGGSAADAPDEPGRGALGRPGVRRHRRRPADRPSTRGRARWPGRRRWRTTPAATT